MSEYTKGPWEWRANRGTYKDSLVGHEGREVCNFGDSETCYPTEGEEPQGMDRDLIAAAPQLYEALQSLVEEAEPRLGIPSRSRLDAIEKARGVLARAEGKESYY